MLYFFDTKIQLFPLFLLNTRTYQDASPLLQPHYLPTALGDKYGDNPQRSHDEGATSHLSTRSIGEEDGGCYGDNSGDKAVGEAVYCTFL